MKDNLINTNSISAGEEVLDRSIGLFHTSEDEKLYDQLLREFKKVHGKDMEKIKAALETGEYKIAGRLAHTLKSSSGVIGAMRFSKAARKAEKILDTETFRRDHTEPVIPQEAADERDSSMEQLDMVISDLDSEFNLLFDELDRIVPAKANRAAVLPPDMGKVHELIERLSPLLDASDSRAFALRDEIDEILAPLGEDGEELLNLVDDFEFPAAAQVLLKIKSSLGI